MTDVIAILIGILIAGFGLLIVATGVGFILMLAYGAFSVVASAFVKSKK